MKFGSGDAMHMPEPIAVASHESNRKLVESLLSMISAQTLRVCRVENRYPLFRIMLRR